MATPATAPAALLRKLRRLDDDRQKLAELEDELKQRQNEIIEALDKHGLTEVDLGDKRKAQLGQSVSITVDPERFVSACKKAALSNTQAFDAMRVDSAEAAKLVGSGRLVQSFLRMCSGAKVALKASYAALKITPADAKKLLGEATVEQISQKTEGARYIKFIGSRESARKAG